MAGEGSGKDGERKAPSHTRKAIQRAEEKYRTYLEQRDITNQEARSIAGERDALHAKRRERVAQLETLKEEKRGLVARVREHKNRRNALQARGRELISLKRMMLKGMGVDPREDALTIERKIEELDYTQQTSAISLQEENDIITEIRQLVARHRQILDRVRTHEEVEVDIEKVDAEIDALFRQADEEHAKVLEISSQIEGLIARHDALIMEIATITAEANRKHQKFVKTREKADALHRKAMEMKGRVISIKRARRDEIRAEREAITRYNREVVQRAETAEDPQEREKRALEHLKKGGRISLG